jgi:hypothetical protein
MPIVMMPRALSVSSRLCLLVLLAKLGVPAAQVERGETLVGVKERDNRNASIASLGRFVAVAWTATSG